MEETAAILKTLRTHSDRSFEPPQGETLAQMRLRTINEVTAPANGYDCPLCGNKTVIYALEGPEERMVARECKCIPMRRCLRKMRESGLGDSLTKCTFQGFRAEESWQKALLDCAKAYAQNPQGWLVMLGQPGSGKTHLCTAVCGSLLREGKPVAYFSWRQESSRIKGAPPEQRDGLLRQYLDAPYLYIDDLFKTGRASDGTGQPTSGDINLAFTILGSRYARRAPTILSSEYSVQELLKLDEAVGSRIVEMAGKNLCAIRREKGRNYRLKGVREM